MQKNSVVEPFSVSLIAGTEKVWIRQGGGEYQVFPSIIFCLTVPKIFVEEPFSVSLIAGTENVWIREGGVSRFSVEDFLSHSAESFRRRTFHCFTNCRYRKCLDKRGGSIKIFRRRFFVSQCRKIP